MTTDIDTKGIGQRFSARGITPISITPRAFPNETIFVVEVSSQFQAKALKVAPEIELELPPNNIIVVRRALLEKSSPSSSVESVNDSKVTRLIELLNERSRTSEQQPSLEYIRDAADNLRIAVTRRHHLIFGRRGVGKTALLLEAKRQIEMGGAATLWINVQILRGLDGHRAFLSIVQRVCQLPEILHRSRKMKPESIKLAAEVSKQADRLLNETQVSREQVAALVPQIQQVTNLLCQEVATDLFLFVDDLHYLEMQDQPTFLDLLHGMTRDTSAWLKIAGIRNQCRVFLDNPPVGLQIGHDAAEIALDVTLEEPKKARIFLVNVLQTYLNAAQIANRSGFMAGGALDRLVLASGGVPRDFLRLSARSIQLGRLRENARLVGMQDVNEAAGEAGKQKRAELEDDAASAIGQAAIRLSALEKVRSIVIDQYHFTYFRIGLRDKNDKPEEYRLLQSLMDLRMIHLIKGSLSEAHAAGERSEVYMIDLSEYSGSRLKKAINVLDLQGDILVLRKTGKDGKKIAADTARRLVQIFRMGPQIALEQLSALLQSDKPA